MTDRHLQWVAMVEYARSMEAPNVGAEMLVFGAMVEREVEDAKNILKQCSKSLASANCLPFIYAQYLSGAFDRIADGVPINQALFLKRNARKRLSTRDMLQIVCLVRTHKNKGARSTAEAIRRAADEIGIAHRAAEKRYALAKPTVENLISRLEKLILPKGRSAQSMADILSGTIPASPHQWMIDFIIELCAEH